MTNIHETAQAVRILRPDLAEGDAISAVLTADPTLTVDEVIAILDEATEDWQAEQQQADEQK